jgi:hypothetical protein
MSNSCRLCFYHRMMIRSYSLSTKTVPAQTKVMVMDVVLTSNIFIFLKIFDRETKRRQRNWSATQPDFDLCKFIRDEVNFKKFK